MKAFLTILSFSYITFAQSNDTSNETSNETISMDIPLQTYITDLPTNFTWANKDGINYLTHIRNQRLPQWCGSCWAMAATQALSDRIKIIRNATFPDIIISPQVLVSCNRKNRGCHGGSTYAAYKWIHKYNITDETCSFQTGKGRHEGENCTELSKCGICFPGKGCFKPKRPKVYKLKGYGKIRGEDDMMQEIYQRGPIVCLMRIPTPAYDEYKGGIMIGEELKNQSHIVTLVGWGEENGVKYWMIRNTAGEQWGDGGMFKLIRGVNNINIEKNCVYAVPEDTWTEDLRNTTKTKKKTIKYKKWWHRFFKLSYTCLIENHDEILNEFKATKEDNDSLPQTFDWRNVDGVNYVSVNRNEHNPRSCRACWVFATTSSLNDRIAISKNNTFPQILLSPQVLINCNAGGSCNGGDPIGVYKFAKKFGIPKESCQIYTASNPMKFQCSDIQQCKLCIHEECWPYENYERWFVKDYGIVKGSDNMKVEIFQRGPISCGIQFTEEFFDYEQGIFEQSVSFPFLNHEISIVGWSVENETEYWIVRNSWGTSWGEDGFARIRMHKNNLGIERSCNWGILK